MNHLDPRWLQSFAAIAQTGALARAAVQVNRTPSAVSMQLRQLEAAVGTRLVERTTRSLRLSADGERFLPYARQLLEMQAAAHRAVRPAEAPSVWRVGISEYFMAQRLGELLALLETQAAGHRLELLWTGSAQLVGLWRAGQADTIVFTSAQPVAQARVLRREPLAWVEAPGRAATPGATPLVLLGPDCPVRDMALRALERAAIAHRIRLTCSGSQAAIAAIRAGWGVGCLNVSAIPPDLARPAGRHARHLPAPGRIAFQLLSRPAFHAAARALSAWAAG